MCTNKRWIINKYTGKSYFVKCGKCPACQQEKAASRSMRIRNNFPQDGSQLALFVTLTYRNGCVPYVTLEDLKSAVILDNVGLPHLPKCKKYIHVPLRRDQSLRNTTQDNIIDYVDLNYDVLDISKLKELTKKKGSVGFCYFKDAKDFIKRLRQIILRDYASKIDFKYFCCSEYGPATLRPHFHLLIFVPTFCHSLFAAAIAKAWPYDDNDRTRLNTSIAKDCAAYVSSYCNSNNYLPKVLQVSHQVSPSHSFSHGFGFGLDSFCLFELIEKILLGDLTLNISRVRKGTSVLDTIIYPKYTLYRFFPKFKGFSRLNSSTIQSIVHRPWFLYEVNKKYGLEMDLSQIYSFVIRLNNLCFQVQSLGISLYDYALAYSRVYDVYCSNLLRFNYSQIVSPIQNFYAYDNINQYYDSQVSSPSLDECLKFFNDSVVLDPNLFPQNVADTLKMKEVFKSYSKDRKIRNYVYSKHLNV